MYSASWQLFVYRIYYEINYNHVFQFNLSVTHTADHSLVMDVKKEPVEEPCSEPDEKVPHDIW